ncbi:MAG: hypothetical protein KH355_03145 [Clostridiales bacterium]|nr:hypothetical protein [Clostridiales bacterium]
MKLEDYQFGFADATKEYSRVPEMFESAFCDPRRIVNKLLNSYEFLLIGRKGVGKSAFCSKIQSLAENSNSLYAFPMNLNDFEFSTFAKTGIDKDVSGTQKYKASWDFLLLVSIYKVLFNNLQMTEVQEVIDIIFLLDKLGFALEDGIKSDVTKLSKVKVGANIFKFDLELEKEFNVTPATYLERLSLLVERMLSILLECELNGREVVVVIDGFDDILRYKKDKMEIIASLIRSADFINDKLYSKRKKIKILLLIREDLISVVTDPDLNKIIHDSSITLSWNKQLNDLKELVNLRFKFSGVDSTVLETWWYNIFPRKIRNKDSWEYVLDYTLYKPRDVLQFLKYCQIEYPDNVSLSISEVQKTLKVYSNKYFIEEMKNELSGFIADELIVSIPSIFRRLGQRAFELNEIHKLSNQQNPERNISIEETKMMLNYLFEAGYIGQLISSGKDKKRSVVFKYRNTTARIDYYQQFITHQGLHSGLGVIL